MESLADRDTRVGDYLDDKLQTAADLGQLDALIAGVQEQHQLLKQQLEDAESDLKQAQAAHRSHASDVQARGAQFSTDQDAIDRRLQVITQSTTSDDAVRKFEASMDKLRHLDVTAGYVELLQEVDALSTESANALGTSDDAAVAAYRRLRNLHTGLVPLQEAAEGAAPHLLDHVAKIADNLHDRIRSTFVKQLEAILKRISWPREDATIPANLQDQWRDAVGKLLELQRPELEAAELGSKKTPVVLLPLQVLVHPLELKFRYHFEGDKPTNRLDHPEYFLQFATENVLGAYNGFMVENIQPLLIHHFRGSDLSMNPLYIDATSAFITATLPMVRQKVVAQLPRVAGQPQLLSHTIHEIMKFDTAVREDWGYTGGFGVEGWKGVAWEVLVQKDWFNRWLEVETDFAFARYRAIIEEPGSGELDFDSMDAGQTKPTKAAIRVNDLLETITDRYRDLSSFSQKLRFLIDIQIGLFDRFHRRLHDALEAFVTRTTSLGRTIAGTTKDEQQALYGIKGLDELCRVFGSAEFLEKAMRDWSDDVFFLDLYAELQDRVQHRGHKREASKGFAGGLSVDEIAEKTSNAVTDEDGGDGGGGMFDETAASYNRLRVRSEGVMIDMLQHNTRETLRTYRSITAWASIAPSSSSTTPSAPVPELSSVLDYLSSSLIFLKKALGTVPLRRVTRALLSTIDDNIFNQIVKRNTFSTQGAAQLAVDIGAIAGLVERGLGHDRGTDGVVKAGLGKLLEAVQLLNLPVRGSSDGETPAEEVKEAADMQTGAKLGLWQVEKRLFADNESARSVLEELGMERLNEGEARAVLERRVELGG